MKFYAFAETFGLKKKIYIIIGKWYHTLKIFSSYGSLVRMYCIEENTLRKLINLINIESIESILDSMYNIYWSALHYPNEELRSLISYEKFIILIRDSQEISIGYYIPESKVTLSLLTWDIFPTESSKIYNLKLSLHHKDITLSLKREQRLLGIRTVKDLYKFKTLKELHEKLYRKKPEYISFKFI